MNGITTQSLKGEENKLYFHPFPGVIPVMEDSLKHESKIYDDL